MLLAQRYHTRYTLRRYQSIHKERIVLELSHIQESIRFTSHQHHEMLAVPPFTAYFHESDVDTDSNYAIPDECGEGKRRGSDC